MTDAVKIQVTRDFMSAANRLPTLWSLSAEWDSLLMKLDDPEQADPDAVALELQALAGDIKVKAYGVAVVIQKLEKMAEWQRAEAKRLAERAKAAEAHADRLRAYALECMNAIDIERIETGTFTLSVRLNNPSVRVLDAAAIPSEFNRTTIKVDPDKIAILAYTKATGEVVAGTVIERTPRLQIS
jgi:hypothetical protein